MSVKTRVIIGLGIVCAAAASAAILWSAMATTASAGTPFSPSAIPALARAAAARSGDKTPTLIQHVTGTRAEANRLASGDVVPGEQQSYLIAIKGHFVVTPELPPLPPGVPVAPQPKTLTYTVMTLIVDATTGQITDSGLANSYPDLAALGPVTTDASTSAGG